MFTCGIKLIKTNNLLPKYTKGITLGACVLQYPKLPVLISDLIYQRRGNSVLNGEPGVGVRCLSGEGSGDSVRFRRGQGGIMGNMCFHVSMVSV